MAKKTKEKIEKPVAATIFDYISWLTDKKKEWKDLSYADQKGFNVYILNRFLSMDIYLCEAVNNIQELVCNMEKEMAWETYYLLLPKSKFYLKYIKAEKNYEDEKLINIFTKYFNCTEQIAVEYIQLLRHKNLQIEIENIKNNYKYE